MALIGNYTVLAKNPGRAFSGSTISDNRSQWNKSGAVRNRYIDPNYDDTAGTPNGYRPPYTWIIPQETGGLSSYTLVVGTGGIGAANLAGGINGEATLTGAGALAALITGRAPITATLAGLAALTATLEATGRLDASLGGTGALTADLIAVLNASATLSGSGTISTADIQSVVNAIATLAGTSSITATLAGAVAAAANLSGVGGITATLTATVDAAASLAGAGSMTGTLTALANAVAALTGTGAATGTMRADGFMEANISVALSSDPLTPEALAAAVWNTIAEDVNTAGTTGQALNLALAILRNKTVTDPVAGTFTVYAEDGTTVLLQADLFEDADGTTPYSGAGAERRERLT